MIFCSDLDNTLIHSYKQDIGVEKVLVEKMGRKELSYMTEYSFQLLEKISKELSFIPVTTRSLQQYQRINFGTNIHIPYAVVANGAILLENNKINEKWTEKTKDIVKKSMDQLEKGMEYLKKDKNICYDIKMVDESFVFTKSNQPEETILKLKEKLNMEELFISNHLSKVYIFPKKLNKGESVKRLKDYLKPKNVISAGDSAFDISMFQHADLSFCPNYLLENSEKKSNVIGIKNKIITDIMLKEILKYICNCEKLNKITIE